MALQSPSSSSSSSFSSGFTYDVFLSFRGIDTRFGFIGNLYKGLTDRGIRAFIDDRDLQGGDEITPSLIKAIEDSKISIPVFSINYASSSFCLDELVHIIYCFKAKEGRLVLPVFYGVDPSHVRHQTGSYGEAIAQHEMRLKNNKEKYTLPICILLILLPAFLLYSHASVITLLLSLLLFLLLLFLLQNNKEKHIENMERLWKWKRALKQAANFSGHHFDLGNDYEYKFIGKIIEEVSNKINRALLHVADYPVGLESRLLQVKWLLDYGPDDGVHIVGVYGIGGMGKTTLARAIYNLIGDRFEGLCFLHNVRENSTEHGLEHLQEELLSKTIGLDVKLRDVSEGIPIIKQRLCRKKVLLILDDIDELKQLQVMVGEPHWLGPGSRVIITTRDKHLLAAHGVERTYEVEKLNEEEALELLMWKAFKNNRVDSSYGYILNRAITYASGLPLALEVVGSNLYGKHIEEWKSTLDRYERIPNKEIQKILKVSFDSLEEDERSVFLDIACCFNGYRLAEVERILQAHHGQCMKYHIRVLAEKSLIKIVLFDIVTLHDLIEDMGKEIVRQESPKEAGKRSRLWSHEDIVHVFEEKSGTSEIEIIYLDCPFIEVIVDWDGKAFKKMKNLKTLIIRSGHFLKDPEHFPSNLRVLEWQRYPSRCMPSNFHPKKLVICKLPNSCLTSSELSRFLNKENLKVLNFNYCKYLTYIPDVSGLPLEEFSFEGCENLITIHNSVGFLNKLQILNAKGCSKLRSFPSMGSTSLQQLELSYCDSLKNFPEILGKMENMTDITLVGTKIEELPSSFLNLTRLHNFLLEGCGLHRFVMLDLSWMFVQSRLFPRHNDNLDSMVYSNGQCAESSCSTSPKAIHSFHFLIFFL